MKLINISSYLDFVDQIGNKSFLMHNNEIQPSFDLMVGHSHYFTFANGYTESDLNHDIMINLSHYDRHPTKQFYFPNTNMHSHSNETRNIHGYIMKRKEGKPNE